MMAVRDIVQSVIPQRFRREKEVAEPIVTRGGPYCDHIPEARLIAGTLTHPQAWLCRDCGQYIVTAGTALK